MATLLSPYIIINNGSTYHPYIPPGCCVHASHRKFITHGLSTIPQFLIKRVLPFVLVDAVDTQITSGELAISDLSVLLDRPIEIDLMDLV